MSEEVKDEAVQADGLNEQQLDELDALQPDFEPKGDQPEPQTVDSVDMLATMISVVYAVAGGMVGRAMGVKDAEQLSFWALSQQEAKSIAVPADQCIRQYFPDYQASPLLALGVGVSMVTLPRIAMTKQIADAIKESGEQGDPQDDEAKPPKKRMFG